MMQLTIGLIKNDGKNNSLTVDDNAATVRITELIFPILDKYFVNMEFNEDTEIVSYDVLELCHIPKIFSLIRKKRNEKLKLILLVRGAGEREELFNDIRDLTLLSDVIEEYFLFKLKHDDCIIVKI